MLSGICGLTLFGVGRTNADTNLKSGLTTESPAQAATVHLGVLTRNVGGMVVVKTGASFGSVTTANTGLLGTWAYCINPSSITYAVGAGDSSPIIPYAGGTEATQGTFGNMTDPNVNYTYSSPSTTLAQDITGNSLTFTGGATPTINLGGHTLTINGILLNGASIIGLGTILIGASGELDIAGGETQPKITCDITGNGKVVAGGITPAVIGWLTLSGTNTYSGGTIVNSCELDIRTSGTSAANSALGTGPIMLNDGVVLVNNSNPGVPVALATNNEQIWNGSFSYASGSPLSLGTGNITILSNSTIANNSPIPVVEAGTISGSGDLTFNNISFGNVVLNGAVNQTGRLINSGPGLVTINGNIGGNITRIIENGGFSNGVQSTMVLAGTNSYTGGTMITSGVLQVGNGGTTGNLAPGSVLNNGTLIYNRSDNLSEDHLITGSGKLQQTGTGILMLTANNNYVGGTTIGAGTLLAANTSGLATGSGLVTVGSGATLGGTGSVAAITLATGSHLLAGTTSSIGTLTASSVLWNGTATFEALLDNSGGASSQLSLGSGSLTKGTGSAFVVNFLGTGLLGQTYTLITFGKNNTTFQAADFTASNLGAGLTGVFSFVVNGSTQSLQVTVVPVQVFTDGPPSANIPLNIPFNFTYTPNGSPAPLFYLISGSFPPGLTLSPSGAISGSPQATGTFTGTVAAVYGPVVGATQNFSITVTVTYPNYSSWAASNGLFGPTAVQTAALKPDKIANLLKYALGLNPGTAYNPGSVLLPVVQMRNVSGANYLTLSFSGFATDVTYNVQSSNSPAGPWSSVATFNGPSALSLVTVQDTQPVSASKTRYMRLQVTSP